MPAESRDEADVVVAGGGGAGLAAAIEAAATGASVLLLEKEGKLGGTTGRSVGSITASGTNLQRRAGVTDDADAHFADMPLFAGEALAARDNLELRRLLVDNVTDTVSWLEKLGVVFFGPMPEPPHRVPRMHNILPSSKSYIHYLSKEARRRGVRILLRARAQELILDGKRVAGVQAMVDGRPVRIAAKAMVLATGDYSSGAEFKRKHLPEPIREIEGINMASTGDGQRLGLQAGGEIANGDLVLGPEIRFVAPPAKKLIERVPPTRLLAQAMLYGLKFVPSFILRPFFMMFVTTNLAPSHNLFRRGAILVNKEGRRFADEHDKPQFAIPQQPDRVAFIVFDHTVARAFAEWPNFISTAPGLAYAYLDDYRKNRRDIFAKGATLRELAGAMQIPAEALERTVTEHNASVPRGAAPIAKGPFYALGPAKSWIVIAEGGLKVDTSLRVLDGGARPIPGLYAAGSTGQGGLLLEGHGHHLGWAFTSGRIAGRYAARAA